MLTGIVIFLLLVIALLAIPISLSFQVSWHQTLRGDIRLLWLFGLIRIPIPLSKETSATPGGKTSPKKKERRERSTSNGSRARGLIHNKPLRRRVIRFVRDFWRAIDKKNLRLHLRLGLGDPADTGQLWAVVGPIAGVLAANREASVEIEPDFFDSTLEMDSSGDIRIIPLQLLYLSMGLLLSPPVRRALKPKHGN